MNLKLDQDLMEKELTPVLLSENTAAIKDFDNTLNAKVQTCCNLLNAVNAKYSLENNAENFPSSVNEYILKAYLEKSKFARDMNSVKTLTLRDIQLTPDLLELQSTLQAWESYNQKDSIAYLIQGKDGFSVNTSLVNCDCVRYAETQRIYIEGEQIVRLKICNDMLFGVEYEVKKSGLDFNSDSMRASLLKRMLAKNPFLSYVGFKPNRMGNYFTVNENYILTGSLNF